MPQILLSIAIGYLLGSIPFAYLMARAWGVDIFTVGTRNPGAANVYRQVGAVPGTIVLLLDIAKAAAAVWVAHLLMPWYAIGSAAENGFVLSIADDLMSHPEWRVLAGLAAIIGHWYPIFLKFRGGAGLAAAIGASLAMLPVAGGVAFAVGLLFQWKFKSTIHSAVIGLIVYLGVGVALGDWRMPLVSSSTFAAVFGFYVVVSLLKRDRMGGPRTM